MSFIQGLGRILKKASPLAMLIPGVGPAAAAGIAGGASLLGGAMEKGKKWKVFDEGIAPAAMNAGLSFGGAKLGGLLKGAGAASEGMSALPQLGLETSTGAITSQMAPRPGASLLSSVGNSIRSNPLEVAKLGMDAYGGYKEGQMMDRMWDIQEREREEKKREEEEKWKRLSPLFESLNRQVQGRLNEGMEF